jgi:hypothetical protein
VGLAYSLALLVVLVIAWIAVRRVIGRPRRRLKKYSKWRKQPGTATRLTAKGSSRSDMRASDDPTTTMSSQQKNPWKGGASSSGMRNSTKVPKKR